MTLFRHPERNKFSRLNLSCRQRGIAKNQIGPIGACRLTIGQLDRGAEAFLQSRLEVEPAGGVTDCEALGQAINQPADR